MTQPVPAVLYADPWLLAADKPSGLLAAPGRGPDKTDCLPARLQPHWGPLWVVHRLDQGTSGLTLLARDAETAKRLMRAFAERRVEKRYRALTRQAPADPAGEIRWPLRCDWPNRPLQHIHPLGKAALTRYRCRRLSEDQVEWTLEPLTGRSHQLRVHLASLGCPILGDDQYHGHPAPRLMLHAEWLEFAHPWLHQPLTLHAPAPFATAEP